MAQYQPSERAKLLTPYFLHSPSQFQNIASQLDHRLGLVSFWGITPGSRVLEIGCGQGDCTVVLADAVGEAGHVDALDPGSPDYGAPYTLSQSQSHILSTPLGSRITFHNNSPVTYLSALSPSAPKYDFVILSHCIYYFESPSTLPSIITALKNRTRNLCIAEWSLHATTPASMPHVLTALLLASLEAKRKIAAGGNIRTVVSPAQITGVVHAASSKSLVEGSASGGFRLGKEAIEKSNEGLLDAHWEVSDTLRKREKVLSEMEGLGVGEREIGAMRAGYDAVEMSLRGVKGGDKGVKCMDHWRAVFESI